MQIAASVDVLGSVGGEVTKDTFVNDGRKTVQLQQGVLQRRRGEKYFATVFQSPADVLAHSVALPVSIPQLVRLVNDNEVPLEGLDFSRPTAGKMQRTNNDAFVREGIRVPVPYLLPVRLGVEDQGWQVKLLLKFQMTLSKLITLV